MSHVQRVLVLVLLTCTTSATAGERVDIRVGHAAVVAGGAFTVEFRQMVSDERCPLGVECFWEGDATVVIAIEPGSSDEREAELHTYHGYQRETRHDDYIITLEDLSPYPIWDVVVDPESFVVTLEIERGADLLSTGAWSWSTVKATFQ